MNLNDRKAEVRGAFENVSNGVRVPSDFERRALALIEGDAMDFANRQAMPPVAGAAAAEKNSDGLEVVAREEKALQVSVLVAGERKSDWDHFSNSRSNQSSIRKIWLLMLSVPGVHGF